MFVDTESDTFDKMSGRFLAIFVDIESDTFDDMSRHF